MKKNISLFLICLGSSVFVGNAPLTAMDRASVKFRAAINRLGIFGARTQNPTPNTFNSANPFDCLQVMRDQVPTEPFGFPFPGNPRTDRDQTLQRFFARIIANQPIYFMVDANPQNAQRVNPATYTRAALIARYPQNRDLIPQNLP